MKFKRIYTDGTTDFVTADTPEKAKNKSVKRNKTLKALHIIDIVTGVVLAVLQVFKAVKN
ncbi:hypothetical protein [Pedobacter nototheniae]|uniref:hypothetical protein n=1 Tax=Pedobacter nototheniae TaxID=2488994 RepID=UPI00103CF9EE|nr:hypothetical protein [Pedobacter nototheniae]